MPVLFKINNANVVLCPIISSESIQFLTAYFRYNLNYQGIFRNIGFIYIYIYSRWRSFSELWRDLNMGLLELFITASIPVLKTLLLTALGSYLALESVDILGEDARKHLNTVSCWFIQFMLVVLVTYGRNFIEKLYIWTFNFDFVLG